MIPHWPVLVAAERWRDLLKIVVAWMRLGIERIVASAFVVVADAGTYAGVLSEVVGKKSAEDQSLWVRGEVRCHSRVFETPC